MEFIAGIAFFYLIFESVRDILAPDRQILEDHAKESERIIEALRQELTTERTRRAASDRMAGKPLSFKIPKK